MSLAVRGALASLGKGVGEGQFGQRERSGKLGTVRAGERKCGRAHYDGEVSGLCGRTGTRASGLRSWLRACSSLCMIYFPLFLLC